MTTRVSPASDAYRRWVEGVVRELERQPPAKLARFVRTIPVCQYPPSPDFPYASKHPPKRPFQRIYEGVPEWIRALRAGLPAAVEVAIDAVGALDVERAAVIGAKGLALGLWPEARNRIARVLSKSATRGAFEALLGSLRDTPAARASLKDSGFADGCALAQRKLEANPALRFDRISLPGRKEWDALTPKQRERAQEKLEALDTSDPHDVAEAEALIIYLGEKRCRGAQPLIARLYADHPSENVRVASGHALVDLGDEASLGHLIGLGDSGDEWRQWFATKATIAREPAEAIERLGGEEWLKSGGGEDTALRALDVLNIEAEAAKGAKRKPWVTADPRWLDIAAHWAQRGREDASYVLRFVPAARRARALARARAAAKRAARLRGGRAQFDAQGGAKGRRPARRRRAQGRGHR